MDEHFRFMGALYDEIMDLRATNQNNNDYYNIVVRSFANELENATEIKNKISKIHDPILEESINSRVQQLEFLRRRFTQIN